jgi:CheY-like chemotaxis protein
VFENLWALIVEDDAHCLIAVTSILKELGIQYKRNTTGARVVEQARHMNPKPHFILLDMDLPKGDPLAICQALREDRRLAQIPVIAMSYRADVLIRIKAAGFAGGLLKPLPRKQVGPLLKRILSGEVTV